MTRADDQTGHHNNCAATEKQCVRYGQPRQTMNIRGYGKRVVRSNFSEVPQRFAIKMPISQFERNHPNSLPVPRVSVSFALNSKGSNYSSSAVIAFENADSSAAPVKIAAHTPSNWTALKKKSSGSKVSMPSHVSVIAASTSQERF